MPVYDYEGTHYDLPDGLTNEQAIAKIKSHLDEGKLGDKLSNLGDKAIGVGQTAASLVTGAAAGLLAPIPAGLKFANDLASGRKTSFQKDYPEMMNQMTYEPSREAGQEMTGAVGEAINQLGMPMLGIAHTLPFSNAPVRMPFGKNSTVPKSGLDTASLASELEKASSSSADRPSNNAVDTRNSVMTDQMVMNQLKEADAKASLHDAPEFQELWKKAVADGDQALLEKLKALDREQAQRDSTTGVPTQGQEPIYVDPQGQAFRGNPADPLAREGLERQGEAFDNAATYNQWPKPGDPLELLQKDNLRSANEGPQFPSAMEGMQHQFKAELERNAADNHPFVQKAMERVTKQEELVTKLSEQVEKGKAQASTLARETKNLENFEQALERTKANVLEGIGEGQKPVPFGFDRNASGDKAPFNFKRQGGAVNPEVFKEGFTKLKQLADGTWLRAYTDKNGLNIEASKDSRIVGNTTFDAKHDPKNSTYNLEAFSTHVHPDHRSKGYAQEMYKFASELGNDIQPSTVQTREGRNMWEGFKERGLSKDGTIPSPGNKQKGALLVDPEDAKTGKFLSEHPALKLPSIVPERLTADQVRDMAKGVPDVEQNFLQKLANLGTKGGLYQALKTDNPVIKFTHENISQADRLARGDIQEWVHDKLGPATRALDGKEKSQIWEAINTADLLQKSLSEDFLRKHGANDKQIAYWQAHTEVMAKAFEAINKARDVAGLDPIKPREAYAAMKATGDYRKLVYKEVDGVNTVVGIVGSNFRPLLNFRADALMKKGFTLGEEKYYGGVPKTAGSAQQAMAHALEVLAKDDPRVAEFMKTIEEISTNEAYNFLNAKKHTLNKKGVFGMEGRKGEAGALPWSAWADLGEMNAKEGMQAQLQYAESALKWARLSEAVEAIKPVLADKDIQHPVAKQWSEDYVRNALGYNPSEMGHNLEVALSKGFGVTGLGYSNLRSTQAMARKTVNFMLLSLDPGFWATNVVQPMRAMPGMKAYLVTKGLDLNFDFGTGYSYLGKAMLTDWNARMAPERLSSVQRGAYEYARTNHVYGSDLVEHSNRASKDLGYKMDKVGNFAAGNIESGTRQIMFFAFTDMLQKNGLSVKNGLYEAAHNLTDMTMNNYSPVERPSVYNSLGPIGDMAVNLSSFKHNEFSRISLYMRQLSEEKSARPILAELATSIAFAGIAGTAGYDTMNWLYKEATKLMGKPDSLTNRVIEMSEKTAKATGTDKMGFNGGGKYALSHGGFSMLGIDMSKRLGLQQVVGDSAADIAFPGASKLGDVAKAGYQAIAPDFMPGSNGGPSEMNTKRFLHEIVPRPAATNMDLEWFSKQKPDGQLGLNKKTLEGQVMRTEGDINAKRLGLTGIHESVEKDKLFQTKQIKEGYADLRKGPLATARDEIFSKGQPSQDTVRKYIEAEGDVKTLLADIARIHKDQNMSAKDREMLGAIMSRSITNMKHAERLRNVYENK